MTKYCSKETEMAAERKADLKKSFDEMKTRGEKKIKFSNSSTQTMN